MTSPSERPAAMDDTTFSREWDARKEAAEDWLRRLLPPEDQPPAILHRAMRYSVFAGGKRLRAVLFAAAAEQFGYRDPARFAPAAAIEMIHTYSLIHDDLPAMDDDDFRRGKPTCHKEFGEAAAILAGDALLTLAFRVLATHPEGDSHARARNAVTGELALAAGTPAGMVAGQALDLAATGGAWDAALLHEIHHLKTGALIRGAVRGGAILAGAGGTELAGVTAYAESLGLAFQITDDILDLTASREELGKTPGKDARQEKLTFPAMYGLAASRKLAADAVDAALSALRPLPGDPAAGFLGAVARFVLHRGK